MFSLAADSQARLFKMQEDRQHAYVCGVWAVVKICGILLPAHETGTFKKRILTSFIYSICSWISSRHVHMR